MSTAPVWGGAAKEIFDAARGYAWRGAATPRKARQRNARFFWKESIPAGPGIAWHRNARQGF
jgi:hypothetical protein